MGYVGMGVDFENAACAGGPPVQSASPAPARSGSLYVEREQTCEAAPRSWAVGHWPAVGGGDGNKGGRVWGRRRAL